MSLTTCLISLNIRSDLTAFDESAKLGVPLGPGWAATERTSCSCVEGRPNAFEPSFFSRDRRLLGGPLVARAPAVALANAAECDRDGRRPASSGPRRRIQSPSVPYLSILALELPAQIGAPGRRLSGLPGVGSWRGAPARVLLLLGGRDLSIGSAAADRSAPLLRRRIPRLAWRERMRCLAPRRHIGTDSRSSRDDRGNKPSHRRLSRSAIANDMVFTLSRLAALPVNPARQVDEPNFARQPLVAGGIPRSTGRTRGSGVARTVMHSLAGVLSLRHHASVVQ